MFVAIGLVAWMAIVGLRLVQLQITPAHRTLRARQESTTRHQSKPVRRAARSSIARAASWRAVVDTESFYADPREIKNVNETARRISSVTDLNKDELIAKISAAKESNKKFIWLIRRLDLQTGEQAGRDESGRRLFAQGTEALLPERIRSRRMCSALSAPMKLD